MEREELAKTPNARDPWGVLRKAVPGVLVDRVNIAGNENGQQAAVAGKGSVHRPTRPGTSTASPSPTCPPPAPPRPTSTSTPSRRFNVSTGGTDLTMQTGGIGINMVTKRGTNAFHGGARYLIAQRRLAVAATCPTRWRTTPACAIPTGHRDKADHIQQISDYGFDLGGPIIKDKLWFYGTYGKQDIRLQRLTRTPDKTLLPSYNGKLNWQVASSTMFSAFYFVGKKQKFGRGVGFPVTERTASTVEPGQRLHGRRHPRRPLEGRGEPHVLAQLLHEREGRLLRHGLRPRRPRRRRPELHPRLRQRRRPRAPTRTTSPSGPRRR